MSTLPPTASLEEIDDEIMLQQVLLDSLGDDVPEDDERRLQIQAIIDDLDARLSRPQSCAGAGSPPCQVDGASDTSLSEGTAALSLKRRGSSIDHQHFSKRATPNPMDVTRASSTASTDSELIPAPGAFASKDNASRARERQRAAEELARSRRELERADAALAVRLSQPGQHPPSVAGSSRAAAQTASASSSAAPVDSWKIFNSNHRPVKREPSAIPAMYIPNSQRPHVKHESSHIATVSPEQLQRSHVKREASSHDQALTPLQNRTPDVVDLTGDSDESPIELSHRSLARTPQAEAADYRRTEQWRRWEEQRLLQQRQAEAQQQRLLEQQRRMAGNVYSYMPPAVGSSTVPMDRSTVLQQRVDALSKLSGGASKSMYESAMDGLRGAGKTVQSWGDDLHKLGRLINGAGDDDDDLFAFGSRSLRPDDIVTPEEVAEDLRKLMDNIRPDEDIPIAAEDIEIPGMTVRLKPYQGTGLTWLQNMEAGTNQGGILADDMGLGKTVQAIALMVTRPSEDPLCKTTLILAPVALLRQWKEEIANKIKRGRHTMSVFIHHGSHKANSFQELKTYDVVLTTFGTVAAEAKKRERYLARLRNDPQAVERPDEKCTFIGDNSKWYRIIIDEAQCIKNKNTRTAKAAYLLQARSRFCMTGTPMMNSVDELFSLIHFIRIRPYNDWRKFSMDFSRPVKSKADETRAAAMQKLQILLKAILLRRNKQSKVNGQPILVLPERTVEATHPVFTEEERDFYRALEVSTKTQFNTYVKAGTVGKSYAHILVLLLRLRQACCHPHLIKDFGVAAAADISPEDMEELARKLDEMTVNRIKESGGNFECPVCYDAVENPAIFIPCGHDTCTECFAKIADPAQAVANGEEGARNAKCPNCRGPINTKSVIDYETFKKVHLPVPEEPEPAAEEVDPNEVETESDSDATDSETDSDSEEDDEHSETEDETLNGFVVPDGIEESEADDDDESDTVAKSPSKATDPNIGRVSDIDDDDEPVRPRRKTDKGKGKARAVEKAKKKSGKKSREKKFRKGKGKGKENEKAKKVKTTQTLAELKKLSTRSQAAKREYLRRVRRDWIGSAKIDKTLELLQQINDETDEKVIIFSQWTSLLDLLEVPMYDKKFGYTRYDGSMSSMARADAVDDFKGDRKIRMMLVSLKAGNAGLNLNVASQVIILDPFWNPYVEDQAIDRAHRLGQTRPVRVHRLLVEDTVEDRILELQEKKRDIINEALDEGGAQRAARLSQRELAYLFGVTRNPNQEIPGT